MRKTFLLFITTIIFIGFYLLNFNKDINKKLIDINHNIKMVYIQKKMDIESIINQHLNQTKTIKNLQLELQNKHINNIYIFKLKQEIKKINNFNSKYINKENINIARSLYFEKLNIYTRIWLDTNKNDDSINGLISNNNIATGIVKLKNNKPIALLNQDEKCNYGVYIGKENALGITHGIKNSQNILIKFIPLWNNINIGDEVITNGLDNIFFEGLKVGKVIKIIKRINHLEAIVKPYASSTAQSYYIIYNSPTKKP